MKEHADWLPAFADPEIRPRVTPFAGKDIDWLLRNGAGDRPMFASDDPHHEGTDDPIGRHEQTPAGVGETLPENLHNPNFEASFPDRRWW